MSAVAFRDLRELAIPVVCAFAIVGCSGVAFGLLLRDVTDAKAFFAARAEAKMLQAVGDASPQSPGSLSAARPLVEGGAKKLGVMVSEKLNVVFGQQGLTVQSISVGASRAFGGGLTCYKIKVTGRGQAGALDATARWLQANQNAIVLQRLNAQPAETTDGVKLASVDMDLLVLARATEERP